VAVYNPTPPVPHGGSPVPPSQMRVTHAERDRVAEVLRDAYAEGQLDEEEFDERLSRTMAAIIEQHHDERGIRWPISVAPYHVDLIVINPADSAQLQAAESLYDNLWEAGVEVVLDDRDERAGVKFNDADLIGFPFRVVVGPRTLGEGKVEVKARVQDEARILPFDEAVRYLQEQIAPHVGRGGALVESRSCHPGI